VEKIEHFLNKKTIKNLEKHIKKHFFKPKE
jgi:hypothetical protein